MDKAGVNAANRKAWVSRFDRFTEWMQSRTESRIIAVAHHGFFYEGLDIRLDNCEGTHTSNPHRNLLSRDVSERLLASTVAEYELSKADGWKLVKRQPGKGGPGQEGSLKGPMPFPIGKPSVLQPGGLGDGPYTASLSELLKATIPLTVIVIAMLSVMFGGGEGASGDVAEATDALR